MYCLLCYFCLLLVDISFNILKDVNHDLCHLKNTFSLTVYFFSRNEIVYQLLNICGWEVEIVNQKPDFSLFNRLYSILQSLVRGESPGVHVAPWRSRGRIPACDEVKGPTQVTEHLNSLSSAASRN